MTLPQLFGLNVLDGGQSELFEIVEEFIYCFVRLAFEVFEVDEDALLLALNTRGIRICLFTINLNLKIESVNNLPVPY